MFEIEVVKLDKENLETLPEAEHDKEHLEVQTINQNSKTKQNSPRGSSGSPRNFIGEHAKKNLNEAQQIKYNRRM